MPQSAKDELKMDLETLIEDAQMSGVSQSEILEAVTEVYWAAVGGAYLSDHYGGDDQVPPRLVIPDEGDLRRRLDAKNRQ